MIAFAQVRGRGTSDGSSIHARCKDGGTHFDNHGNALVLMLSALTLLHLL